MNDDPTLPVRPKPGAFDLAMSRARAKKSFEQWEAKRAAAQTTSTKAPVAGWILLSKAIERVAAAAKSEPAGSWQTIKTAIIDEQLRARGYCNSGNPGQENNTALMDIQGAWLADHFEAGQRKSLLLWSEPDVDTLYLDVVAAREHSVLSRLIPFLPQRITRIEVEGGDIERLIRPVASSAVEPEEANPVAVSNRPSGRKSTKRDAVAEYIGSKYPEGIPSHVTNKEIANAVKVDERTVRRARGLK